MRYIFFLVFTIIFFFISPIYSQKRNKNVQVDELLKKAHIPGIAVVYLEESRIAETIYSGVKSTDRMDVINEETVFSAASLSKCVFAYIVLQLVEEKVVDLDTPLYKYFEYTDIEHDNRSKKVTARMVLTHTTGLPNWRNGELNFKNDPGNKFGYSGEGFVWLQKTIESITNKTLEVLAQERVFLPLGMTRTSYIFQESFKENHALPHDQRTRSNLKNKITEPNAAHSLQTTASDYAKFLMAIINNQGISNTSVEEMLKPQVLVEKTTDPAGSIQWGLGVGLQITSSSKEFWHWGDNGTFKAFFTVDPINKKAVVYFTNGSNGLSITKDVSDLYMNSPQPAIQWIGYQHYQDPKFKFYHKAYEMGIEEALKPFLTSQEIVDTNMLNHRNADWTARGWIKERRFDLAGPLLLKLREAYPKNKRSYNTLGNYYLQVGELHQAIEVYQLALKLDPEDENIKSKIQDLSNPKLSGIEFYLSGYKAAKMVSVVGSFNDWDDTANICLWRDGAWRCNIDLKPGEYEYKYRVDGVNILDPRNPKSMYLGDYHASIKKVKK